MMKKRLAAIPEQVTAEGQSNMALIAGPPPRYRITWANGHTAEAVRRPGGWFWRNWNNDLDVASDMETLRELIARKGGTIEREAV